MEGFDTSTQAGRLFDRFESGGREAVAKHLEGMRSGPVGKRKALLRSLRNVSGEDRCVVATVLPELAPFLDDADRAVRLSAAKLCVSITEDDPGAGVAVVPELTARLADEDEFYYVRARSAEALGYVAIERTADVASPEVVAELRVGLEFDEPEVREKLAKALAHVALGDPSRLRHQVTNLEPHLDDDRVLVRYHLCTALAAVGCAHPSAITAVGDALLARLDDEDEYVRGRAAEAVGLAATGEGELAWASEAAGLLRDLTNADEEFAATRARFAQRCVEAGSPPGAGADAIGTVRDIRETTAAAVDRITTPDADGECPHCGLELPSDGPPFCPRCGVPR